MYLPGQFFSESPHFPNLLVDEGVEQHQHQQVEHVHEDGIHPGDIQLVSMDKMMKCSNPCLDIVLVLPKFCLNNISKFRKISANVGNLPKPGEVVS